MKKILLPPKSEKINYYRANLHCHSTISDGSKTPEELKRDYMNHGYSVIAFTDHEALISHNDLTDDNFLALNAYELDLNEEGRTDGETEKVCHLCLIALSPDNLKDEFYHREKYFWGNSAKYRDKIVYDENKPDFEREYTAECINEIISEGVKNGFFVTYNHPTWSLESYPQYSRYSGMNAMEIVNYGCVVVGYDDDNGHCYDDMLNCGNKLYCIATDDNHNRAPDTDPDCDSYGGYVEIASPDLSYESIASALKDGLFYSSTGNYMQNGPEILSLTYENNRVYIGTSDARSIQIIHNTRICSRKNAKDGEYITEAEFEIDEDAKWFRLVVTDYQGFKAYTNAYFISDLNK